VNLIEYILSLIFDMDIAYKSPTLNSSWKAFKAHISTYIALYLLVFSIGIASLFINFLFIVTFIALGDGSEAASSVGNILGTIVTFPLSILNNLFGVLLIAVPTIYYSSEEVVSFKVIIKKVKSSFWRYILAGIFWTLAITIGFIFCIIPGIMLTLITPIYVHKIFVTDLGIIESFQSSWSSLFDSGKAISFFAMTIFIGFITITCTILTCLLGGLVFIPLSWFYIVNYSYHIGILKHSNNLLHE